MAGMSIEGVSNVKKQHDTIGNNFRTQYHIITCMLVFLMCWQAMLISFLSFFQNIGEYSNPQLEHLIEWINATVPVEASFAGNCCVKIAARL